MKQTDEYYIERCRDGHADDYRYLVRRYQGFLLAHLTGQLRSKDSAEEAAQETFVRAYFALEKLKNLDSFFPWLLGIANRVAKEQLRSMRPSRPLDDSLPGQPMQQETLRDYALERAVAALPESYRRFVLLRYYEGLSCRDVAQKLDVPLGTVTKKLSRAYAMLRKSLQENEEVQK